MRYVIRNYDNFYYYVELVDGNYIGNKIENFYSGMNTFRTLAKETIKISESDLEIIVNRKGSRVYLWQIVGRVVPIKDSDIKIII